MLEQFSRTLLIHRRAPRHVETVVLLSKENISTKHVRVEFNLEEMDMSGFKVGATYEEIIAWVQKKYG